MVREIVCVKFTAEERKLLQKLYRATAAESLSEAIRAAVRDAALRAGGLEDDVQRAAMVHRSERPRRSRALAKLIGPRRRPPVHVSPRT